MQIKEHKKYFHINNQLNKGYHESLGAGEVSNSIINEFDGALPPLEVLSEYESLKPGITAKLLELAKKEQELSEKIAKTEQKQKFYLMLAGTILAFSLVALAGIFGIILLALGFKTYGIALLASFLVFTLIINLQRLQGGKDNRFTKKPSAAYENNGNKNSRGSSKSSRTKRSQNVDIKTKTSRQLIGKR